MPKHPLQFLEVPRRDPEKESAEARVQHYGEIYGHYDGANAAAQAGRTEAGAPLWRRLAYVAVTRAQERLIWVTRWRLAKPEGGLGVADLP